MSRWDSFTWDSFTWDSPDTPPGPQKAGKMKRKVIISFVMPEDAFEARVGAIIAGVTANPKLVEPWFAVGTGPTVASLEAKFALYVTAKQQAEDGDKGKIAARVALRESLTEDLQKLGNYINTVLAGDLAGMESTGFLISKEPTPLGSALPEKPLDLRLKHGDLSGTIVARSKRPKGSVTMETQVCSGDPNVAGNWQPGAISTGSTGIVLSGLTPGTIYCVRVRAINKNGPGAWSDIASLMAM